MDERRFWLSDFADGRDMVDPDQTIAILPLAATEQHGPHLPVTTDANIMDGMLAHVRQKLHGNMDVRVLPVERIGLSLEHIRFSGTETGTAEALLARWTGLGEKIAASGIRKLVIINSHGGNEALMAIVALQLRERHDMMVVKTSWERFGFPEGLVGETERRIGIHGGFYETSVMLHFKPESVELEKAQDFSSRTTMARKTFTHLAPQSPHAFAWLAGDLNAHGVTGNAAAATAQAGEKIVEHQTDRFVELLDDVRRARLEEWIRPFPA